MIRQQGIPKDLSTDQCDMFRDSIRSVELPRLMLLTAAWSCLRPVVYPPVMTNIAVEDDHLWWIFPLKIVIFHSYIMLYYCKLPEGHVEHVLFCQTKKNVLGYYSNMLKQKQHKFSVHEQLRFRLIFS